MKTLGIIVFFSVLFITSCVLPPSKPKLVIYKNDPCIIPYNRYKYKTCDKMRLLVDFEQVTVPAGFVTDLASIPRPLWPIVSPHYSPFIAPSIVHDYLYRCPDIFTRKEADDIFYSTLLANGVTKFTSTKFYIAVRLFGWLAYGRKNCNEC